MLLLRARPPFLFATLATCFFGSLSHRYVTEDFPTKLSKGEESSKNHLIINIHLLDMGFSKGQKNSCAPFQRATYIGQKFALFVAMMLFAWAQTVQN